MTHKLQEIKLFLLFQKLAMGKRCRGLHQSKIASLKFHKSPVRMQLSLLQAQSNCLKGFSESYSKMQNGVLSLESFRNDEITWYLLFQNTVPSDAEVSSGLNCYWFRVIMSEIVSTGKYSLQPRDDVLGKRNTTLKIKTSSMFQFSLHCICFLEVSSVHFSPHISSALFPEKPDIAWASW